MNRDDPSAAGAAAAAKARSDREAIEDFALRDDYALNPTFVRQVMDAADRGDSARVRELVGALRPADVADLMGFVPPAYRAELIADLPRELLVEVLPELDDTIRDEVLDAVSPARIAEAVSDLDSDDAAAVLEDMEDDQRAAVLAAMSAPDRAAMETALAYPEDTAGRLMQREVMAAPQFWTVGQTIDHIRADRDELPEQFFDVYVVDPSYKPIGEVGLSRLLRAPRDTPLAELIRPVTEIDVDQDQEEVAYVFEKYNLISAPVVDDGGRLIGQITVDDIVDVLQEENQEDILALAGVGDVGRDAGVFDIVRSRFPWLVVNLFTALLASLVIGAFQDEIGRLVALAVLMPVVASIGGNAGTQALTVAVRSLATRELSAANSVRIVAREIAVGLINGVAFAVVIGLVAALWFRSAELGGVIAAAVTINLTAAALAGVLVPLTLHRMGRDPAVSSPVFVTATTDIVGFLSFLGLASLLLL